MGACPGACPDAYPGACPNACPGGCLGTQTDGRAGAPISNILIPRFTLNNYENKYYTFCTAINSPYIFENETTLNALRNTILVTL